MPDSRENAIAVELARLRARYLARLPTELEESAALAASISASPEHRARAEELLHRLHKLAGSGGSFGLSQLSQQARAIELRVGDWLARSEGKTDSTSFWPELAADVGALASCVAGETVLAEPPAAEPAEPTANELTQIWLLEAEPETARELQSQLEQFGYGLRIFHRQDSLASAARTDRPDFIIADLAMATESTWHNHTDKAFAPECPVVFTSARDEFDIRLQAARMGAVGFVAKPPDVPQLVGLIERHLKKSLAAAYRILIVDDDEHLTEHFRLVLLAAGMDVQVSNDPHNILQHLANFRPELVLLDLQMPGISGPELAAVIRQHENWFGLPIVYLSAETDVDKQARALGHSADDFLTKPISDARLISALRFRVARARQVADLMSKDSLTGLLKHGRIKEEIDIELSRAQRSGQTFSVAMVDIDHFKSINDQYGHAMGDRVIQALAHVLQQRLRKSDGIGRYGGEEFALALPGCDAALGKAILDDIRERFSGLSFLSGPDKFHCTLSAGIACSHDFPTADGSALLRSADAAMYAAKRGGRNQVQIQQTGNPVCA